MTDKEIMSEVVTLLETIHRNEESRMTFVKIAERRFNWILQMMALLVSACEMEAGPMRAALIARIEASVEPGEFQKQTAQIIARVETQQEKLGALIETLRKEIEEMA